MKFCIQHYPQKPIINTRHAQYTGSDYMANGVNLIVESGLQAGDMILLDNLTLQPGTLVKTIEIKNK